MKKLSTPLLLLLSFIFTLVAWNPVPANAEEKDEFISFLREPYSEEEICKNLNETDGQVCKKICSEMFKSRKERNDCEELEVKLIKVLDEAYKTLLTKNRLRDGEWVMRALFNVYRILKTGDKDRLKSINNDVFKAYLSIDSSLENIVKDYSSKEAKDFFLWLIDDEDISDILRAKDFAHKALKVLLTLFKAIDSDYDEKNKTWSIFNETLFVEPILTNKRIPDNKIAFRKSYTEFLSEGGFNHHKNTVLQLDLNKNLNESEYSFIGYKRSLMEFVIESGSKDIMYWFLDYIYYSFQDTNANANAKRLKIYCEIGQQLSSEQQEMWHENFNFEDYLDDIIFQRINVRNWNLKYDKLKELPDDIQFLDDLKYYSIDDDDTWVDALCDGLEAQVLEEKGLSLDKTDQIFLYGDNHRSQKSADGINSLKEVAKDGSIYMALEGFQYGPIEGSQTIYGIESEMELVTVIAVKSYVMLYRAVNGLHGQEFYLSENVSEFIGTFLDQDSFAIRVWEKIPRPFQKDKDESLALIIDQTLRADDPFMLIPDFSKILRNHPESFMNVAKVFAMEAGEQVEGLEDFQKEILNDTIQNPHDIEKEALFSEELAVKWRDKQLIKNILKVYDLAKADNKSLYVAIGCGHLDSLKEKLESSSKKVELIKGIWCL